jgi:hypothetical protein
MSTYRVRARVEFIGVCRVPMPFTEAASLGPSQSPYAETKMQTAVTRPAQDRRHGFALFHGNSDPPAAPTGRRSALSSGSTKTRPSYSTVTAASRATSPMSTTSPVARFSPGNYLALNSQRSALLPRFRLSRTGDKRPGAGRQTIPRMLASINRARRVASRFDQLTAQSLSWGRPQRRRSQLSRMGLPVLQHHQSRRRQRPGFHA